MSLANKITILRLIFVVPFITLLTYVVMTLNLTNFSYKNIKDSNQLQVFIASGILFVVAMITDYVDGMIARKTNTVTSFGKLFDP